MPVRRGTGGRWRVVGEHPLFELGQLRAGIESSILEADCEIQDAALSRSLIGTRAKVLGTGDGKAIQLNVGDDSHVLLA